MRSTNSTRLWGHVGLIVLLLAGGTATAAEVVQDTLANGLQVHIQKESDLSLVTVNMYFAAGRATDPDSLAGLAHLAEHLLTQSSEKHPDGGLYRKSTLYSTYRNASTGGGHVQFVTQCLPAFLPTVIALEAERMRPAPLDAATFERERSVVLEELAYRRRLSPFTQHQERMIQACYAGHPFGEKIGGTAETVGAIQLDDYEWFCREFINPARAALVIRGPVDLEETLAMVDSLLGGGPVGEPQPLRVVDYPSVTSSQVIDDSPDFDGVRVSVACRIPLDSYENIAFAGSLGRMLETFPYYINLISFPGEALVFINTFYMYHRVPKDLQRHYGYLYRPFDPDQDALYSMGAIWKNLEREMEDLHEGEVYAERLEAAMAEPLSFRVGPTLVSGNSTLDEDQAQTTLGEMTRERFVELVHEFLIPTRAVVGITHGRDSERQQAIELAARVARDGAIHGEDALSDLGAEEIGPVLEAYREAAIDPVYVGTLGNGIPFLYLEIDGQKKLNLGGCRMVPPLKIQRQKDKPGIVPFYDNVVAFDDRQVRHHDDPEYRPQRLPYDYSLSLRPGLLTYSVSGRAKKVDRLAYHMARRLESEKLHQEVWFRTSLYGQERLAQLASYPFLKAQGWRMEQIFGADYFDLGFYFPKPKTSDKLKYKDLQKLHRSVAEKTGQTVLFGTGSYEGEQVQAALEKHFGTRSDFRIYEEDIPQVVLTTGTPGCVVPDLGRGDVSLELTLPPMLLEGSTPEGILLMETILQQVMNSRLRQQSALTYGVSVRFTPVSGLVLWEIKVTCQPGQAHLALEEVRGVMARIGETGFSEDEVARARLDLTGRLIRQFDDPDDGFGLLLNLGALGGTASNLTGKVASFPVEDLESLVEGVVDPHRFAFTATGPMFEEDIDQFFLD